MTNLNDQALLRYSRHILLPEIDIEGQERLLDARALVIGAGGLGSPVALYLASAGVGHLTIVDDDVVELGNLQRQIIHDDSCLGINKAKSAAKRILALNSDVEVLALSARVSGESLQTLVGAQDVVLDCSDNFSTRQAVNAACVHAKVPLVSGAAVRFSGQLIVYDSRNANSPCYSCVFPNGSAASDGPCATFGVLAPLVGVIGSMQAVEGIKILSGINTDFGCLTMYDALSSAFSRIRAARDVNCAVCGNKNC